MSITITDTTMASSTVPLPARLSPDADGEGTWLVPWLPGRLLTRDQATTAMVLAEHVAAGHGRSPHTEAWAAELHLTGTEVLGYLAPVLERCREDT